MVRVSSRWCAGRPPLPLPSVAAPLGPFGGNLRGGSCTVIVVVVGGGGGGIVEAAEDAERARGLHMRMELWGDAGIALDRDRGLLLYSQMCLRLCA